MALPITAGLAGIAGQFIPWFLGEAYRPVVPLMYVCSPLVLVVGLSDYMGSQILTPGGKRAQSAKVIVAGAGLNAFLNLLLIPRFGAAGAAAASVAAELFITGRYLGLCRGYLNAGMLVRYGWKRALASAVMLLEVMAAGRFLEPRLAVRPAITLLQIGSGAVVYGLLLLVMRDSFLLEQLEKAWGRMTGRGAG